MKKLAIAIIALVSIALTSCSNKGNLYETPQDFTFTAAFDTTIVVKVPVLDKIHIASCAGGGYSKYQKVTNWQDEYIAVHKGQTVTIPYAQMRADGYYHLDSVENSHPVIINPGHGSLPVSGPSEGSSFPDWLKWLIGLIIAFILFLIIWGITHKAKGDEKAKKAKEENQSAKIIEATAGLVEKLSQNGGKADLAIEGGNTIKLDVEKPTT